MSGVVEKCTGGRFYGVYLLCSQSPEKRYNGKCYIGFTVNPNRRIKQHNRGKDFGGAKKTNNKGPWKMVMIVHGFPNNISALQFEWAWQQPTMSTRLKTYTDLRRKKPKETYFQYNFRILNRMLLIGPWNRLPLTIRWLETDYECDFPLSTYPPKHMQIVSGQIVISKTQKTKNKNDENLPPRALWAQECHICMERILNPERSRIGCLNNLCKLTCHLICLANHLISNDIRNRGHYIPIAGECPLCETELTWAALLQRKHALQGIGGEETDSESTEEEDNDDDDDDDIDIDLEEKDFNFDNENNSVGSDDLEFNSNEVLNQNNNLNESDVVVLSD